MMLYPMMSEYENNITLSCVLFSNMQRFSVLSVENMIHCLSRCVCVCGYMSVYGCVCEWAITVYDNCIYDVVLAVY